MKIKFNKFERAAGVFVLAAIAGVVSFTVAVAIRKGWFDSKIQYTSTLASAEGLHAGTLVQVAGLRAGQVEEVILVNGEEVKVKFYVFDKFHDKIRQDTVLKVVRPFIIGEKVLDLSVGSADAEMLQAKSEVPYQETFDMMDILSGRKMGTFLGSIEKVTTNIKILLDAFADSKRTKTIVAMFDRLEPLIKNLNTMSMEVTKLSQSANSENRVDKLLTNVIALTEEMQKLTPAINAIAPDLPRTSKRAVEALDETVVLLKAFQKSFFFRGNVKDVREEELKMRQPASEDK